MYVVFFCRRYHLNSVFLKAHSKVLDIFGNWEPFKNDEKRFLFHVKLFSFLRYLNFCLDVLVM